MNSSESHVGLVLEDGELRDEEEGHEKMETNQSNENGKEEPMDTVPVLEQLQLAQVIYAFWTPKILSRTMNDTRERVVSLSLISPISNYNRAYREFYPFEI